MISEIYVSYSTIIVIRFAVEMFGPFFFFFFFVAFKILVRKIFCRYFFDSWYRSDASASFSDLS